MTLWNIIRDFFVEYIFGGKTSNGQQFYSLVGQNFNTTSVRNNGVFFNTGFVYGGGVEAVYISMGDWLSTTATIITLIGICILLWLFVRWLFRLTSNLITLRG